MDEQKATSQPEVTLKPETLTLGKDELILELSWHMQRVHRIRRALGLEPLITHRRDRRVRRELE